MSHPLPDLRPAHPSPAWQVDTEPERPTLPGWRRAVFGDSTGSLVVGLLALLSAAVYFAASERVRSELAASEYRRTLVRMLQAQPGPGWGPAPLDAEGLGVLAALVASCAVVGVMARRVLGPGSRAPAADLVTWSLVAAIAPTLLLAAVLRPDGRGWLTPPVLLAANVVAANLLVLAAHRRGAAGASVPPAGPGGALRWHGWVLLPAAAAVAVSALVGGAMGIHGFDSLAYHLPLAARWMESGRLATGPAEAVNLFYPGNAELLVRWALLAGSDRYAFAVSFLAAVGCVYALYRICLELEQPRPVAAVAALSAATLPLLPFLGTTVYSDTFAAFALLLAVLHLLRSLRADAAVLAHTAALGASLGLAVGSKYAAIGPALVITLAWAALVYRAMVLTDDGEREYIDARWVSLQLASFLLPALACSGFWYLRNAVEHGNPLFPAAALGWPGYGVRYLTGVPEAVVGTGWSVLLHPWREVGSRFVFESGQGATFAAVALLGVLATPFARRRERPLRSVVWWIVAGSFAFWLASGAGAPRYALFPLLLSFAFVGELWIYYRSRLLELVTLGCAAAMAALTVYGLLSGAVYDAVVGPYRHGVPAAIDSLPPARVLNVLGGQGAYHAMGSDYRHQVITLYRAATPRDVLRYRPHYVLLRDADQLPAFAPLLAEPVGRSAELDGGATSLWRVETRP